MGAFEVITTDSTSGRELDFKTCPTLDEARTFAADHAMKSPGQRVVVRDERSGTTLAMYRAVT